MTLIETVITVAIIGISVTGAVALLRAVIPGVVFMQHRAVANQLAQAKVEQLKNELLFQDWWNLPVVSTFLTPTAVPDARVTESDRTQYLTDWEVHYIDPSGIYPIPTPVPTNVVPGSAPWTAPTGLIRIRANTSWFDRVSPPRRRQIEVIGYLMQRELATPTPGATPTPAGLHTVSGKVTDGGKLVRGGALVLAGASAFSGLPPILPGYLGTAAVYSAFVTTDGSYLMRVPGDNVLLNMECQFVRRNSSGTNTELTGLGSFTSSSGGSSTVNFPF